MHQPNSSEPREPSTTTGERQTLIEFLDYFRAVFTRKVDGLDNRQARTKVPPSDLDLLGMTRHLADVERWWFRMVFAAEVTEGNYDRDSETDPDLDWHHGPEDTLAGAVEVWNREVDRARQIVAACDDLGTIGAFVTGSRGPISMRWILVHMIEEYARHCGHADFLRQAIDGRIGD
jgi:Protein of unknown function (DUF664)